MGFEIETYQELIYKDHTIINDKKNIVSLSVANKGTTNVTYRNHTTIKPQTDPTDNAGLVLISSQLPVRNTNLTFTFENQKDTGNKVLISYSRIYRKCV